jgi:hypothetical protein
MPDENPEEAFTFTISTAPVEAAPPVGVRRDTYRAEEKGLEPHGRRIERAKRVLGLGDPEDVEVKRKDVQSFLKKQLVPLGSEIAKEAGQVKGGLVVDEISLTLGIGAEGGLSFVAKASAQAAITVTLRRDK